MNNVRKITSCLLLLCSPVTVLMANGDTPVRQGLAAYQAEYTLKKKGLKIGEIKQQLAIDGDRLSFDVVTQAKGFASFLSRKPVRENCTAEMKTDALLPISYQRQHTGKKDAKIQDMEVAYNWSTNTYTVLIGEQLVTKDIVNDLWAKGCVQLAIMSALQTGATNMTFNILDDLKLAAKQHYKLAEQEPLQTVMGEQTTLKLIREHGKRKTIMWLAPEFAYLPVKIQRFRKGKLKSELVLQSVKLE